MICDCEISSGPPTNANKWLSKFFMQVTSRGTLQSYNAPFKKIFGDNS